WIMFEDILLIKDQKYLGYKPYRTYEAFRYLGGYSDHLPICLDIPY
ncbi:MAG: endonuclease, partial [Bacteroidales bacterium]|nr:endonuclease [Bacteroidales bacterium]